MCCSALAVLLLLQARPAAGGGLLCSGGLSREALWWLPRSYRDLLWNFQSYIGCFDEATLGLDVPVKCIAWRQTGGCDPAGAREPRGDVPCQTVVTSGNSGYCECSGSRRVRESTCDHREVKCEVECQRAAFYSCIGWRAATSCSADGPRDPKGDRTCGQTIDPELSGFCECGENRTVRKPGCEHGQLAEPFTCRSECAREPNLYEELGLDSSASFSTIKATFRKMSLKYHPDKAGNDLLAKLRFSAIREAYDIIGDPGQRGIYDAGGLQMVADARGHKEKGPAMSSEVLVSLEGFYNGEEQHTSIMRKIICRGCDKNPRTKRCRQCNAGCANELQIQNVQMMTQMGMATFQQEVEVPSRQKCVMTPAKLVIVVERGMSPGDTLHFTAMGEQRPQMIPGDVVITLRAQKHAVFKRTGVDLHTEVNISLKEALLGFNRTIRHLDGRSIFIKVDGITNPFAVIQVSAEGMPHRGDPTSSGHLFVKCNIVMPEDWQLNKGHRAWLSEYFPG